MTTTVDPDVIRALDPRRSYLPKPQPAQTADGEAVRFVAERMPTPARGSLASISIDDLRREIERRQRAAGQLQARREKLVAELAEIDAQLRAIGAVHNVAVPAVELTRPVKAPSEPKSRARNTVILFEGQ